MARTYYGPAKGIRLLITQLRQAILNAAEAHMPDIANLFPFRDFPIINIFEDDEWIIFRMKNNVGGGAYINSPFSDDEIAYIKKVIIVNNGDYKTTKVILGDEWLSFNTFTYVGPASIGDKNWKHYSKYLDDWLVECVIKRVLTLNEQRILRAIPKGSQYNVEKLLDSLWVLECEEKCYQGTAFELNGYGLVTCSHVIGSSTHAFKINDVSRKYPIKVLKRNDVIDIAVIEIETDLNSKLDVGNPDAIKPLDHLAVLGFPNYQLGDSGYINTGNVTSFRMVSGIRRVMTNALIVAGNSGGPVVDSNGKVIGVAVTGVDDFEAERNTEKYGIVPINVLELL